MSSSDFGEDLSRSNLPLEIIAKLMTNAQQQAEPLENDTDIDYEIVSPLEDIHNVGITAGSADVDDDTDQDLNANVAMFRRVPESPFPYDLVHVTSGGSLAFPIDGRIFSAGAETDGATKINITDDTLLNPTDKFAWIMMLYPVANTVAGGGGTSTLLHKGDGTWTPSAWTVMYANPATEGDNMLSIKVRVGGSNKQFVYNYTPLTWVTLGVSWEGGSVNELKFYVNGVKTGSTISTTGTLDVVAGDMSVFGRANSTHYAYSGSKIAWLTVLNAAPAASWFLDVHNGILDTTETNAEITTIPFWSNENAQPNCTPGIFAAGS
jgi:hypothetical protein